MENDIKKYIEQYTKGRFDRSNLSVDEWNLILYNAIRYIEDHTDTERGKFVQESLELLVL